MSVRKRSGSRGSGKLRRTDREARAASRVSIGPLEPAEAAALLTMGFRQPNHASGSSSSSKHSSRNSSRSSLFACRPCISCISAADDEDDADRQLMCIKVYCSTVDPNHMYHVLRIDTSTTAAEVVEKMKQQDGIDEEADYYLLYTKFSGASLASLLPPRVLEPSDQLFPFHMEEKAGRIELLQMSPRPDNTALTDAERLSSPMTVPKLEREPSAKPLFDMLVRQAPLLEDTATRELIVLPAGVVGLCTAPFSSSPSSPFNTQDFQGLVLPLRSCGCDDACVVVNYPDQHHLSIVPLPGLSTTITVDKQPLTEAFDLRDGAMLGVGSRAFRVHAAPDVSSPAVPLPLPVLDEEAGTVAWTAWHTALLRALRGDVQPTEAVPSSPSPHNRSSLDDEQALKLFLEMEELATRDASMADDGDGDGDDTDDGSLFGRVRENESPNELEVTTTTAKRAYDRWRMLKKGMLTNMCDVDMEALHQADVKNTRRRKGKQSANASAISNVSSSNRGSLRGNGHNGSFSHSHNNSHNASMRSAGGGDGGVTNASITVRPLLITWVKLIGTVMAVEKSRARDIHNIFDGDNDGKLTRADVYGASQFFNLGFTPQETNALFDFLDANRDNYIDVGEFCKHARVVYVRSEFFSDKRVRGTKRVVPANELISRISVDYSTHDDTSSDPGAGVGVGVGGGDKFGAHGTHSTTGDYRSDTANAFGRDVSGSGDASVLTP
ncbi:hypothetical protein PTSG_10755 [Salpingoeca rosetta]|uniref:EF-hand domain-containing protein n=1 Tax=Salpingoeca rosetta (strain ATCC 50818 / BSB-021) TaxID=946362 RepID=F2UQA2_SALR5|nr:uncharacterized protein PTSG_10755 [Salpingoeca rosetta]EGD79770.1 hypothetical protein PTSG_10755 [Salpingoeca rosetta]|eukprot:XP_004988719.1 hypothetical protein PTSG_10755 [Salpingoeca rosetta]